MGTKQIDTFNSLNKKAIYFKLILQHIKNFKYHKKNITGVFVLLLIDLFRYIMEVSVSS